MSDSTNQVNQTSRAGIQTQSSSKDNKATENQTPSGQNSTPEPLSNSIQNLISKAGDSNIGALLQKIQPIIDKATDIFYVVFPYVVSAAEKVHMYYNCLPLDIIYALVGLLLVFFGGVYTLLIAAVEAFYMTGYDQVKEGVLVLREEFSIVWDAFKKDNEIDDDNDGVADVKTLTVRELIMRKSLLFLETCRDPQKVMSILTTIITSFISVIAVLKVEFAKVIALGHMIGDAMKKPANYLLVPALANIVPAKFHKWISPLIEVLCKFVAISIAWFIQRVISSVQSAIRGGLIFSRRFFNFLKTKGIFSSYDEDDYWDEVLGWTVATIGIYCQLSYGFGLPFPLNILLFPVSCFESYLSWAVSN